MESIVIGEKFARPKRLQFETVGHLRQKRILPPSASMTKHDPDAYLRECRSDGGRLCFYPSCGNRSPWVVGRLDADVFVFSDYRPKCVTGRRAFWQGFKDGFSRDGCPVELVLATVRTRVFCFGTKLGFLFFQDNNEALARIAYAGWKINSFVGVCDGCQEGGNYECVHNDPFLSKLLGTAAEGMDYFTDHSDFLQIQVDYFQAEAVHPSGWQFRLRSLLFRPEDTNRESLQILRFPERTRIPLEEAGSSLGSLLPFRQSYRAGKLAHYEVRLEVPSN
jgi:hypothetical protein